MKKNKLFLLSIVAAAAIANSSAYAEADDAKATCEKWVGDYNDVHCTYVSGLSSSSNKGRYIKHYDSSNSISYTRCVTADTVEDDIYQSDAEFYIGTRSVQYFICSDANAEHCEPVGIDTYTVAKNGETYVGTPTTYGIDLSAVKDKYPECDGLSMNMKQPAKLSFKAKR